MLLPHSRYCTLIKSQEEQLGRSRNVLQLEILYPLRPVRFRVYKWGGIGPHTWAESLALFEPTCINCTLRIPPSQKHQSIFNGQVHSLSRYAVDVLCELHLETAIGLRNTNVPSYISHRHWPAVFQRSHGILIHFTCVGLNIPK